MGQLNLREMIINSSDSYIYFQDTNAIQTEIWAEKLIGEPVDIGITHTDLSDHYIILAPTVDFVDDGTRYFSEEHIRWWFFYKAVEKMFKYNLSFSIVPEKDFKEREAAVCGIATKFINDKLDKILKRVK